MKIACLMVGSLLVACGGGSGVSGETQPAAEPRVDLGAISVAAPDGWNAQEPSSGMRKAQWQLEGGGQSAELVVYHFGPGAGGGVEDNLQRWYAQFEQADGRPSSAAAKVERKTVDGIAVTTVDLAGRYVAETRPGSGQRLNEPNWRMLAAVVEAPHGFYYIKLVGPAALIASHADRFAGFIDSIRATKTGR